VGGYDPCIAIVVRRFHDIDKSGWWYLLIFTIGGAFVVLYWLCSAGDERDNQYGSDRLKKCWVIQHFTKRHSGGEAGQGGVNLVVPAC
jgi:hypothetical protein